MDSLNNLSEGSQPSRSLVFTRAPILGRLEPVDLRSAWQNEAGDFTPWLAHEENIRLLGESIGMELEVEAQEQPVGPFRADILCKDTATEHWVLIENQLARTDHTHLGQLLTYAAGLQAVTIVWIAAQFTEEHRATLDWLNEITDERFNFFGLTVELWRIGDSDPAPKFNIVSKPNDWSRRVSGAATRLSTTPSRPREQLYLDYWTALCKHLEGSRSSIRPVAPKKDYYLTFPMPRASWFHLDAVAGMRDGWIAVRLYFLGPNAKAHFQMMAAEQAAIEAEVGVALDWKNLNGYKSCEITLTHQLNPSVPENWPVAHEWTRKQLEVFDRVFRTRIRRLLESNGGQPLVDQ